MIRPVTIADADPILEIYTYYVETSHSTFELTPPTITQMQSKIQGSNYPWLVLEEEGKVIGYAYATEWKAREAYQRTVETSVYLHKKGFGRDFASRLYQELLMDLKSKGYHTVLAGISLPNEASVRLHEKLGFRKVGQLQKVGFKFNRWIDVGYWQLEFSPTAN